MLESVGPAYYAALFLPVILIILLVHEGGHLIAAKLCGVKTLEFGIGIPPRLASIHTGRTAIGLTGNTLYMQNGALTGRPDTDAAGRRASVFSQAAADGSLEALLVVLPQQGRTAYTEAAEQALEAVASGTICHPGKLRLLNDRLLVISDMTWSLNLLPIGAFVRLAHDPGRQHPQAVDSRPAYQRTLIILAGVLANLLFPAAPIAVATFIQTPPPTGLVITEVVPNSPADRAGLSEGYAVRSLNGQVVATFHDLRQQVAANAGRTVTITLKGPDGRTHAYAITPDSAAQGELPRLGVVLEPAAAPSRPDDGPMAATAQVAHNTLALYRELGAEVGNWMALRQAPELASPLGAAADTGQVIQQARLTGFLIALSVFSVNVGIVNLLPLIPLDGGRLVLVGIEKARRGRPVSRRTEERLTGAGIVIIGATTVFLVLRDLPALLLSP